MILIRTADSDAHADQVCALLSEQGRAYARFDPAALGVTAGMAAWSGPGPRTVLRTDGGPVDLEAVRSVWWRRPGEPATPKELTGPAAQLAHAEWVAAGADLFDLLDRPGVRVLPGAWPVIMRGQHKLRQLRIAAGLGFTVPATLITDDPDAVLDFAAAHPRAVSKRVGPGLPVRTPDGAEVFRYTEVLSPVDLLNVDAVRLCPITIQEYVPKRLELRVTVVGDRVFAAAIHSQSTHHTRDDWRRYDNTHTAVEAYELPAAVARRCVAITRALGLCFGAIDLVLTPDDRHVFLEINPSGQYLWIEMMTGLPIAAAVTALLTGDGPC